VIDSTVPIDVVEGRRQRRKDARPAELTTAALNLFVERGYAATRLDDVAARAGVSKGTLYLYFDSKETLFKAVIQEGILPMLDDADQLIDRFDGTSTDLLKALLTLWWNSVGATPLGGIPKLLFSEARNFPDAAEFYHREVIQRGNRLVRRALQRGIAGGEFRPIDLDSAVELLFAPILMLVIWRHSMGPCAVNADHPCHQPEKYLAAHIDLALNGLLQRPALPEPPL
jgi:AcrR family transcriptional regulator